MTDEEISVLAKEHYSFYEEWCIDLQGFARAVEARVRAQVAKEQASWLSYQDSLQDKD